MRHPVVIVLLLGIVIGWFCRRSTTNDRYIQSLAEHHFAEAGYYNRKTDLMVQELRTEKGKK